MENQHIPTPSEIWKILKEVSLGQKETDRRMQETNRRMQETDRHIKETNKETKDYINQTSREIRELKNIFSNKWGELVESLVSGCLLKILKERNIQVTGIFPNVKTEYKDPKGQAKRCEIDILARNGQELVAVEVKSTLGVDEVNHFLEVLKS